MAKSPAAAVRTTSTSPAPAQTSERASPSAAASAGASRGHESVFPLRGRSGPSGHSGTKRANTSPHPPTRAKSPPVGQAVAPSPFAAGASSAASLSGAGVVGLAGNAATVPPRAVDVLPRPRDLQVRTPSNPSEEGFVKYAISSLLKSTQVQSCAAKAGDGCRWWSWPIQPTREGGGQSEARLLTDAEGVWHRMTVSTSVAAGTFEMEVQFGKRPSNEQWLERMTQGEATAEVARSDRQFSKYFVSFLEGPDGRMPVEDLETVRKRPLVRLLASLAERAVPVRAALSRVASGIPVTVSTMNKLSRAQLFAVVKELQDDEGRIAVDLSDLRHLPAEVQDRVITQTPSSPYRASGRALMALMQRESEPMGDTSWGTHYAGASGAVKGYVPRYGMSVFLLRRFAAENGKHSDQVGAATAIRNMEAARGSSEPLPWSAIKKMSQRVSHDFTNNPRAFIRFLRDHEARLRSEYLHPPTTDEEKAQRALLMQPKPIQQATPLSENIIKLAAGPLRDMAKAYRTRLNLELDDDPSRESSLKKKLYVFCKLMLGLGEPWGDGPRTSNNGRDLDQQAFVRAILRQHDDDISDDNTSRSFHYFLELPQALQEQLVALWVGADDASKARSILNERYPLGLGGDGRLVITDPPRIQIHREMLAKATERGLKGTPGSEVRSLIRAAEGRRPTDETFMMEMVEPSLVDESVEILEELEEVEEAAGVERRTTPAAVVEARKVLAERVGHAKSLLYTNKPLNEIRRDWYGEPYDPRWKDDSNSDPAAHAPKRPRLASHIELAHTVLEDVRQVIEEREFFSDDHWASSAGYLAARDATVEWLNVVESKMHNTSYDAKLRLEVGLPSQDEFIAQVSADLRSSASAVDSLDPPHPGRPLDQQPLPSAKVVRRKQFVQRMRRLADELEPGYLGSVRIAFDALHAAGIPAPESASGPGLADAETNQVWAGRSIYDEVMGDDHEGDLGHLDDWNRNSWPEWMNG